MRPKDISLSKAQFKLYTQLIDGTVHELQLKPISIRSVAKSAVLCARAAVHEVGESAIIDCCIKTPRKAYRASLGQTSIWYERMRS